MSERPVQPTYREVRSLGRGLAIIESLSELGWSSPGQLSHHTGVDRATIYRLLATLQRCGYAARREGDGHWFLTGKMRNFGFSVREEDRLIPILLPALADLVGQIHWPSDFATLTDGHLRILASTHHLTTMTFSRSLVGQDRPILRSAMGRAILAAMTPEARDRALVAIASGGSKDAVELADRRAVDRVIAETQTLGYAVSAGLVEPRTSAIAVPVMAADEVAGAVNIMFFRATMTPAEAAVKLLEPLRATASVIERAIAAL